MSKRNPVFSERSKVYYGMKNKQASGDPDQPVNPWAQWQQAETNPLRAPRKLSMDALTVLVLLLVCAAVVGVVLLMK